MKWHVFDIFRGGSFPGGSSSPDEMDRKVTLMDIDGPTYKGDQKKNAERWAKRRVWINEWNIDRSLGGFKNIRRMENRSGNYFARVWRQ